MKQYYHSVRLVKDLCKGCTNCIKRCPTEAIRVRDGKARIIEELCVDCGECIRICPNRAKIAVEDGLDKLKEYKFNIALPAPSFYGQFDARYSLEDILSALLLLGFDDVFEVALAAEGVTLATQKYLNAGAGGVRPVISQACPAVMGLIQVRFPLLLQNIAPIESPMNMAAKIAKTRASKRTGLNMDDIGAFFITPCPGKITSVRQPPGDNEIFVDGALSIASVYGMVLAALNKIKAGQGPKHKPVQCASGAGIGWGRSGGEVKALNMGTMLAVDGIHNVISVLEQVEKGEMDDIDYLECLACTGGCIGGSLTVKNPFLARVKLNQMSQKGSGPVREDFIKEIGPLVEQGYFGLRGKIQPRKVEPLDCDLATAIVKADQLEKVLEQLPGLDCSSCGCPNCRALAEDIVRGLALETDCIFKLRKRVEILAEEVLELAKKVPPAMGHRHYHKSTQEEE
ncbi:MAG: [Fe-Fe] hydrogenase large subunit C-terminal domain-containing protein [Bacillota bacterium]